MRTRVGDIYIHKDIGDTYLVTQVSWDMGTDIECINLDKGRTCSINPINWKVFYKPLTHTQEHKCK